MATVMDFYEYLNSIAPFDTQEDWDNSGLLVGDMNVNVTKAVVVLDITPDAVEAAKKLDANLIISHHPVIFNAMKSFTKGSVAFELATNSINALCCHTPLDISDGGTNDVLAALLGIDVHTGDNTILRFGEIEETTAEKLASHIAKVLGTHVRYADSGKTIHTVAICTGSGCSLLSEAGNFDAFITGDASHHDFLDCVNSGISLIAAGHYETEIPVVPILTDKLSMKFTYTEIIDLNQSNPIKFA